MLVISRRTGESLSFTEVGITVHFLRIQAASAKLGIEAPQYIHITRDESHPEATEMVNELRRSMVRLPRETRHSIRNQLHLISVGSHLYKEQMEHGLTAAAEETFQTLQGALRALDQHSVLQRPETADRANPSVPSTALLVEDDANERTLLAALLRLRGFKVSCVENGEQAICYLKENDAPGIILLDMLMPERDGRSTLSFIRGDERFARTKVFVVSGTTPEDHDIAADAGEYDRWFAKPLAVDDLVCALVDEQFSAKSRTTV